MPRPQITKEFLEKEYIINKKSSYHIAKDTGYSDRYIRYKLEEYSMLRSIKDAMLLKNSNYYNPLYTPMSWNLPVKRRDVYLWANFFFKNYPDVNNYIKILCNVDYSIKIPKNISSEEEENIINFNYYLPMISETYFVYGDCFIFKSIEKNKTIKFILLNPAEVSIEINPDNGELEYFLRYDEKIPDKISMTIAKEIKEFIDKNKKVKLEKDKIIHIKRNGQNNLYGKSFIQPYFTYLSWRDKKKNELLKLCLDGQFIDSIHEDVIIVPQEIIKIEIETFKKEINRIEIEIR